MEKAHILLIGREPIAVISSDNLAELRKKIVAAIMFYEAADEITVLEEYTEESGQIYIKTDLGYLNLYKVKRISFY